MDPGNEKEDPEQEKKHSTDLSVRGGIFLKEEDSETAYWKCRRNHTFRLAYSKVKSGGWCQICNRSEKFLQLANRRASTYGGKCLSDFCLNDVSLLEWLCGSGHQFELSLTMLWSGEWCSSCSQDGKCTITECQRLASERGGRLLLEKTREQIFRQTNSKISRQIPRDLALMWRCSKRHSWWASFQEVQLHQWCPECCSDQIPEQLKRKSLYDTTTPPKLKRRRFSQSDSLPLAMKTGAHGESSSTPRILKQPVESSSSLVRSWSSAVSPSRETKKLMKAQARVTIDLSSTSKDSSSVSLSKSPTRTFQHLKTMTPEAILKKTMDAISPKKNGSEEMKTIRLTQSVDDPPVGGDMIDSETKRQIFRFSFPSPQKPKSPHQTNRQFG